MHFYFINTPNGNLDHSQSLWNHCSLFKDQQKILLANTNGGLFTIGSQSLLQGKSSFWVFSESFQDKIINSIDIHQQKELVLIAKEDQQPTVVDSQGLRVIDFLRGDMYLWDQSLSWGHIQSVTWAEFSWQNDSQIFSCSKDGSVRLWDLNSKPFGIEKQLACLNSVLIKEKKNNNKIVSKNKKISIKKFEQNFLSNFLIVISQQGDFYFMEPNKMKQSQECFIQQNNQDQDVINSFLYNRQQNLFIQMDNKIQIFDLRKTQQPLYEENVQYNNLHQGACVDQSNQELFYIQQVENQAFLVRQNGLDFSFINKTEIQNQKSFKIGFLKKMESFLLIGLDKKIQILSENEIQIESQDKGVNFNRNQSKIECVPEPVIFTPNALPLYNQNDQVKRYRIEKIREDEKLSNKPEVLLDGPGYSGYISGPRTTAQNIMQQLH